MCLDEDGIDVIPLNGPPMYKTTNLEMLDALFEKKPDGYTPLCTKYREVIDTYKSCDMKPLLIIVATDGIPTSFNNGKWYQDVNSFVDLMKNRPDPKNTPTVLVKCCDDSVLEWMDDLDKDGFNIDVVDVFENEKSQILIVQGNNFPFTIGDYVVKILLGSVDNLYDNLDENKMTPLQLREYVGNIINDNSNHSPEKPKNDECCVVL